MPSSFTVLGLTFHLYGLLVGIGIVVAAIIAERHIKKASLSVGDFWDAAVFVCSGGILGARLWHVITDWHLYINNVRAVVYVWNGGLSIIGALAGGISAAFVYTKIKRSGLSFFQVTDALAVGVPFGQAIGRLGNWVNSELYGTPTDLPWKLFIDEVHRLPGYEHSAYYHPLFLYELIGVCGIGFLLIILTKRKNLQIGSTYPTLLYVAAYGWLRFFLEFFRLEKANVGDSSVGINQVIVLVAALSATIVLFLKWRSQR